MTKKKKHGYDELLRCKPRGLRTTSQANYFRSAPKHHSQKEIEPIDGWPAFTYHIAPTYDFKQEMLSHVGIYRCALPGMVPRRNKWGHCRYGLENMVWPSLT